MSYLVFSCALCAMCTFVYCSIHCVTCVITCVHYNVHCNAQCATCGEHSPPLGGHTTIHCSPTLVLTLSNAESCAHTQLTHRILNFHFLTQLTPGITLKSHKITSQVSDLLLLKSLPLVNIFITHTRRNGKGKWVLSLQVKTPKKHLAYNNMP